MDLVHKAHEVGSLHESRIFALPASVPSPRNTPKNRTVAQPESSLSNRPRGWTGSVRKLRLWRQAELGRVEVEKSETSGTITSRM